MTPDRNLGIWNTLSFAVMAFSSEKWEKVNHKTLLAIAVGVISVLIYWGFSTTFSRLNNIEVNQATYGKAMADNQVALIKTISEDMVQKEKRDSEQDKCISEIKADQKHVIESLIDLKGLHNSKKIPRLGAGDFGTE